MSPHVSLVIFDGNFEAVGQLKARAEDTLIQLFQPAFTRAW